MRWFDPNVTQNEVNAGIGTPRCWKKGGWRPVWLKRKHCGMPANQSQEWLNHVGLEVSRAQAGYWVEFLGVEGFKELGFGVDFIGELGQKLAQAVG